jgi:hypothetical protein
MSMIYEQAWASLKKLHGAPGHRLPISTFKEEALRPLFDYGLISFLGSDAQHEEEVALTSQGVHWVTTLRGPDP